MSKEKQTIEQKISKLESIVQSLEKGDCTLDEALKQYELGVKAAADCNKQLQQAQQKVQILNEKHQLESFSIDDSEDDEEEDDFDDEEDIK